MLNRVVHHLHRRLQRTLKKTLCRHQWRPSQSWPGAMVCDQCGQRKMPGRMV